ncbi:MAG TPA: helix-turn-helix domain-containing protein [Vicinamibacterales bacterium]|nr:helix-turn-helix domain-containing protein [Vicinamibacterales bacterium]
MSPRPRKVSDDDVFNAAYQVMQRLGPGELTLADIANEAGVTAGALVQRFGSKRDLLLKLSELYSAGTGEMFAQLRKAHRSPLATLRAYAECMAGMAATPTALLRNLQYLQLDLTDEDFRKNFEKSARATREELQNLVRDAIEAKELVSSTNARQLARTIEAVIGGSMLSWAYYQEGTAAKYIRDDLNAVLKPYLR